MPINTPSLTLLSLCLCTLPSLAATETPDRTSATALKELPARTTGVIWGNNVRGSGSVGGNPQVVFSCAHVVHQGTWLQGFEISTGYTGKEVPVGSANSKLLRGHYHWDTYTGSNFDEDFVTHYAFTNLAGGSYSPVDYNDKTFANTLTSSAEKMIVGYPGADFCYQNITGPFTSGYTSDNNTFSMWNGRVRGGSGFSGGGVFAKINGSWKIAGVHVSGLGGTTPGAGARALDSRASKLFAISSYSSGSTVGRPSLLKQDRRADPGLLIPDAKTSAGSATSVLKTTNLTKNIYTATVSVRITHQSCGQLEVDLVSPSGKTIILQSKSASTATSVTITKDITTTVRNQDANGDWKVVVRDTVIGKTGKLDWFTLGLTGF
jgi:hypothetical protein